MCGRALGFEPKKEVSCLLYCFLVLEISFLLKSGRDNMPAAGTDSLLLLFVFDVSM